MNGSFYPRRLRRGNAASLVFRCFVHGSWGCATPLGPFVFFFIGSIQLYLVHAVFNRQGFSIGKLLVYPSWVVIRCFWPWAVPGPMFLYRNAGTAFSNNTILFQTSFEGMYERQNISILFWFSECLEQFYTHNLYVMCLLRFEYHSAPETKNSVSI